MFLLRWFATSEIHFCVVQKKINTNVPLLTHKAGVKREFIDTECLPL